MTSESIVLLIFYNCHLKLPIRSSDTHLLPYALGLDAKLWNMDFGNCTVQSYCEAGVSMHGGVDHCNIHPMSFSLTIALVEADHLKLQPGRCYFTTCDPTTKISKSSVTVYPLIEHSKNILDDFAIRDKIGLWEIVNKFADEPRFLETLQFISQRHAEHADEKECEYYFSRGNKGKGKGKGKGTTLEVTIPSVFYEVKEHVKHFGRSVERMITIYKGGHAVPLNYGPCLSGFSDAKEFAKVPDPCKCCTKSFNSHLETMCNCGHLSMKLHKGHLTRNIGSKFAKEDLLPVAVHNLKATAVERVLAGNIEYTLKGSVTKKVNQQGQEQGIFVADELPKIFEQNIPRLKYRIAFLFDEDSANQLKTEEARRIQEDCAKIILPISALAAHGEIHLLGAYIERTSEITLKRPSALKGCVKMWIGGYAGAETFAAEALFKKYDTDISRAACSLLACQLPHAHFDTRSILSEVKSENANRQLRKRNITLTAEQSKYVDNLQDRVVCSAVAGAGKSTTGAAILLETIDILHRRAESDKNLGKFKTIWLTKTREQRDDILQNLRKLISDPLQVCAVGRPVENSIMANDDGHFDEKFETNLTEFIQHEITLSKKLLKLIVSETDSYAKKCLQAQYYKVQFDIDKKKYRALQSYPLVFWT